MSSASDILKKRLSRREFTAGLTALGINSAIVSVMSACGGSSSQAENPTPSAELDKKILDAAATAEAVAVVMYHNIISSPLYTEALVAAEADDDQSYLVAGREEEAIHYQTLVDAGAESAAYDFYYPVGMFSNQGNFQTTLNTLILLEDAFIAAYLLGVRDLSSSELRVLSAQILGIECEHRALGRTIATSLGLTSTTGLSGKAELIEPPHSPNNLAFERTFRSQFATIDDIVSALSPFFTPPSVAGSGFDPQSFNFDRTRDLYVNESPKITLETTSSVS